MTMRRDVPPGIRIPIMTLTRETKMTDASPSAAR